MYREKFTLLCISAYLFRLGFIIKRKERRLNRCINRRTLTSRRTQKLAASLEQAQQRFSRYERRLIPILLRLSARRQ